MPSAKAPGNFMGEVTCGSLGHERKAFHRRVKGTDGWREWCVHRPVDAAGGKCGGRRRVALIVTLHPLLSLATGLLF